MQLAPLRTPIKPSSVCVKGKKLKNLGGLLHKSELKDYVMGRTSDMGYNPTFLDSYIIVNWTLLSIIPASMA